MEMRDRPRVGTPSWTEADDQRLRSLTLSGMTCREIAREIGRSVDAVQARAKKLGVSLKQVMVRRRL
jgi:transposase